MPTPIETTVRTIIRKYLSDSAPEQLNDEANLMQDLGCDSLDVVEICMQLEQDLTIEISDDMWFEHGETVGGIVRLAKHLKLGHDL